MLVAWQPFISGARLPTLLLTLLGVWMLIKGRIDFSSQAAKRLGIVFLLLLVPALISIPGSFDPKGSAAVAAVLVLFYVVGLALLKGLATPQDREWLIHWLFIVLTVWLFDACIQFLFGRDLLGIPMSEGRILGPFGDNLHLSLFLTVLMPTILWKLATDRPWAALIIIAVIGFIAGMSGSRTSMVMFLLASLILLTQFSWRLRVITVTTLTAALISAVVFSPALSERLARFTQAGEQAEISLFQQLDTILSGRMVIWETAGHMIQDRPLTGVGVSAFAEAYDHYATRPDDPFRTGGGYDGGVYHAHQMYVSAAAETGLTGLAGLLTAISLCIYWYFRSSHARRRLAAPFAAPLAVIVFPLQSQPVLYTIWWFPIVLLTSCGMLAALSEGTPVRATRHAETD